MSRETEALVYRVAKAATERDLDTFLELAHPDAEWHASFSVIAAGGAYHGHDGIRQYVRDLEEAFDAFDIVIEGVVSAGDMAMCIGRVSYRGKRSGLEQVEQLGWVFRFRDGRIAHLRAFRAPDKVLGAMLDAS